MNSSLQQVASFSFKGNSSFLIVMPLPGRANVSSVLPKLNISDLYRRLPQEKIMHVSLPKVKLQYRQELQEALTSMGEETHQALQNRVCVMWTSTLPRLSTRSRFSLLRS